MPAPATNGAPTGAPPAFNPFAPHMIPDPFASYAVLHEADGMGWCEDTKAWIAGKHAHVQEVLRSPDFVPNGMRQFISAIAKRSGRDLTYLERVIGAVLFFDNTAEHKSRRRYFVRVLNDRPLSSFEPYLKALAAELLQPMVAAGGFDGAVDFADVFPRRFMMRLLGVPDEDLSILAQSIHNALVVFNQGCTLADYAVTNARLAPGVQYVEDLVRKRRRAPQDDGLSRMIAVGNEEGADDALVADRAFFLLFAGIETTATLIANAVRLLHLNPGEWRLLREGAVEPAKAIEEILRFECPVVLSSRVATKPTRVAETDLEPGQSITAIIQAANRDPEAFPDPNRLVLARDASPHLSFAAGGHFCVGASLARLEGRIALEGLMQLPETRLATDRFEWWPFQSVRRVKSLPVEFV